MNTKNELILKKSRHIDESTIYKICGLFFILFAAYVYLTADQSSLAYAFHCAAALYLSIVWLYGQTQMILFRMKQDHDALQQRIDSSEQRIASLEKQLRQQQQE